MKYIIFFIQSTERLIKFKSEEFEIGKRHLAKMMGENSDTFTQADIDVCVTFFFFKNLIIYYFFNFILKKSIEYLLPSGLFEKKARPFLRHPNDYYPKSKGIY
jgi:small subunit ribosomal protein S9